MPGSLVRSVRVLPLGPPPTFLPWVRGLRTLGSSSTCDFISSHLERCHGSGRVIPECLSCLLCLFCGAHLLVAGSTQGQGQGQGQRQGQGTEAGRQKTRRKGDGRRDRREEGGAGSNLNAPATTRPLVMGWGRASWQPGSGGGGGQFFFRVVSACLKSLPKSEDWEYTHLHTGLKESVLRPPQSPPPLNAFSTHPQHTHLPAPSLQGGGAGAPA